VPVTPHDNTAANQLERREKSLEDNCVWSIASHCTPIEFDRSVDNGGGSLDQELGRGGLCWKQARGCSTRGFGKALPRDSKGLAGWEQLHTGDKRSGITGDEGPPSEIIGACR